MLAAYPSGWLRQQELEGKFVDEGGNLGDRTWFTGKILPSPPDEVTGRIRYWDLAATEKKTVGAEKNDPDETVGTKLSWIKDGTIGRNDVKTVGKFFIENQRSGFWKYDDILKNIVEVAERDGPYIKIYVEEEPGSGGKNQVAAIAKHVKKTLGSHYQVIGHPPRGIGDKVMRANVWFAEAANGQFYMVHGNWNEGFLDQLDEFPAGKKDDKIDSVSGARHSLAPIIAFKDIEFLAM
jgi:predicted phage terminase large subunit-like protein